MAERLPVLLDLEINGLYIILDEPAIAVPHQWHWCLYLHRSASSGWIFHIMRPAGKTDWFYELRSQNSVVFADTVATALQVASIPTDMHEPLRDRLGTDAPGVRVQNTEQFRELSCRTWLLQALQELDDEGYISIKPTCRVEEIECEAKDWAETVTITAAAAQKCVWQVCRVFRSSSCVF